LRNMACPKNVTKVEKGNKMRRRVEYLRTD
jgi:hypothetical protein